MPLDIKKMDRLDWGVLGGGLLVFISLFLPWWRASAGPFSASVSGWSTSWGWVGGLLLIAAAAWFLLWRAQVNLPKLPASPLVVTSGTAALGLLIVIIRWITLPRGSFALGSVHYGAAAGIYMAAIFGAVETACAAVLFRKSGEALPWATGGAAGAPPAPPAA